MLENEQTKEFGVNDLMPDVKMEKETKTDKKNTKAKTKSKKPTGKGNKKKKKSIYIALGLFVAIVAVFMFYVWSASRNHGPVYGERCAGMPEVSESAIQTTISNMKSEDIVELEIKVECKEIDINMTMASGNDAKAASDAAKAVLLELDKNVGMTKSNEKSAYSDLLTAANETDDTKYHVDFTIKGEGEDYPIFATKHPKHDKINFTYATAKDPDLVEKLYKEQAENSEEE